jgi:hypothetical protein
MERVAKKKKTTPLAACPPRRVPPMRATKQPIESISREEMSEGEFENVFAEIEGYVPENSLVRETVILPSFRLVYEETSGHSPVQSLNSPEQLVDTRQVSEELGVGEALPKSASKANVRRIKSKAN